jgi:hypothetical protein
MMRREPYSTWRIAKVLLKLHPAQPLHMMRSKTSERANKAVSIPELYRTTKVPVKLHPTQYLYMTRVEALERANNPISIPEL